MAINKIQDYSLEGFKQVTNKVQWNLESEKAILLIHDMQVYFANAYNKAGEPYCTILDNIKSIKKECVKRKIPVVYSAQPAGQSYVQRGLLLDFWGEGIPIGKKQDEIVDEIKPTAKDTVITKWRYSAFEKTELEKLMQELGKTQIIITGVYAHIGCLTTATIASMKNIKPFFISDAVGDFSKDKHRMALEYVSQLSGMAMSTNKILENLGFIS